MAERWWRFSWPPVCRHLSAPWRSCAWRRHRKLSPFPVRVVPTAPWGHVGSPARPANRASAARKDLQVHKVSKASKANKAKPAHVEQPERRGPVARVVFVDCRDVSESKGPSARQVNKAHRAKPENKVKPGNKVTRDLPVLQVPRVMLVQQVLRARRERGAKRERRVPPDHPVHRVTQAGSVHTGRSTTQPMCH